MSRLFVTALPFGNFSLGAGGQQLRWYAAIDGQPHGEDGEFLFATKVEAKRAGIRFLTKQIEREAQIETETQG